MDFGCSIPICFAAWLSFLVLIQSGDIETNPGPMTVYKGSIVDKALTSRVDAIVNAGIYMNEFVKPTFYS